MTNTDIGFRHYRPYHSNRFSGGANRGGATLAFASPKHINDLTEEDVVQVAFSYCSRNDNFERARGRKVAIQRLHDQPITVTGAEFAAFFHPSRGVHSVNDLVFEAEHAQSGVFGNLEAEHRRVVADYLIKAIG